MAATHEGGQSYIIKRPRLTKLLDETQARIILLCAPAGYGKTTLAREWISASAVPAMWYAGSPEMLDPVAAESTLRSSLRRAEMLNDAAATQPPSGHAPAIAGLEIAYSLREDIRGAAIFDDYQHALGSADSDALISAFTRNTHLRVIVTTRVRPSWLTSRMEVYGELLVLGKEALAFTPSETASVLAEGGVE